jgi:hypothetical protein
MTEPDWTRDDLTWGEILHPAMEVETEEQATAFFEAYVSWLMRRWNHTRAMAESAAKINIGYFAGYYDDETANRVYRLFHCSHPILGTATNVSPQEMIECGRRLAQ